LSYEKTIAPEVKQKFKPIIKAATLKITGLVQGVGFRPYIYRLSRESSLNGWVKNTNFGIEIRVEGNRKNIDRFIQILPAEAPVAASIYSIDADFCTPPEGYEDFSIIASERKSEQVTIVSPDIAVCDDCIRELKNQAHRINYPFINCTNCGPRFSIMREMPYDRDQTTMCDFSMCDICKLEYEDIEDRRFHAQPIACNCCGPRYSLHIDNLEISENETTLETVKKFIDTGNVVAIKSLGGFNLACDAFNKSAVQQIRTIKSREGKPFAVMFANIETLKEYAHLNEEEAEILSGWARPICILKVRKKINSEISNQFATIGAMLPYLPLHHLLFEKLATPALVMTSANISDEPIIIHNQQARLTFQNKVAAVLDNDRDIHNRIDDSVCQVIGGKLQIIRRARGFAPLPLLTNQNVDGILGTGAELTNCFCLGKENHAILSQHIGDLKNYETFDFYQESIIRFKKLFHFVPELVAYDLHPDYLSTQYALGLGIKSIGIQHHHAHLAAVMAEHHLDEEVIGISFDGTGYGTDGHIWGGEIMVCDLMNFRRVKHFEYMPMPGGERVTNEPWRMAASYLYNTFGSDWINLDIPFIHRLQTKGELFEQFADILPRSHLFPLTSSAGRLFDAVAALTGVCFQSSFQAEAPMRLENLVIDETTDSYYPFSNGPVISFRACIENIVNDIIKGKSVSLIAAKFHNTLVEVVVNSALEINRETGVEKIALSGGVFQNKYLLENTALRLKKLNLKVYTGHKIPVNDGGLALGQLVIAAKNQNNYEDVLKRTGENYIN